MGSGNVQLTEQQQEMARKSYELYAKQASWTFNRTLFELGKMAAGFVILAFNFVALIVMFIGADRSFLSLKIILTGVVIGAIAGLIYAFYFRTKTYRSEMSRLECSEGYTERFFQAAEATNAVKGDTKLMTLGMAYNITGNYEKTFEKLSEIDENVFALKPVGAHSYYAVKLAACVLAGDEEKADEVYEKGFYYLTTYKDSPVFGDWVCLSIGMYKHLKGEYEESMGFLDNAARIQKENSKPRTRIPDENFRCMLCCWKAKNLIALNRRTGIKEMMDGCRNFYKTPFYEKMIDDIVKELENETVS